MPHAEPKEAVYVADNGLSKGWLLAIVGLVIAQVAFIKLLVGKPAPVSVPAASIELDENGRAITMLGDIELHVPKLLWRSSAPLPKREQDSIQLSLCWENALTKFSLDCPKDADIKIFMSSRTSSTYPYTVDAQEHLENRTNLSEGPFESEINGVNVYRHAREGFATGYALTTIDPSGIFPFASCNLYCSVQTQIHAQVHVQYQFDSGLITSWPEIHKGIRDTLESMIPGE